MFVSAAEFILFLDASDSFLKERVINLPERLAQELHYEPEHFLRRLAAYRESSTEDESVVDFCAELDIAPLHLSNLRPSPVSAAVCPSRWLHRVHECVPEVTGSEEQDRWLLMQKIFHTLGPPRMYGPNSQEVEEEERRKTEEKMKREAEERAEEEQREQEEARSRAAHWEEWVGGGDHVA